MLRWLLLLATATAGCSNEPSIPCDDGDGGTAEIVNGVCVSRIRCDPMTEVLDPISGLCVSPLPYPVFGPCEPQCTPPDNNHVCVTGGIVDFATLLHVGYGDRTVHVALYDALEFLTKGTATPEFVFSEDNRGCFTFVTFPPPSGQLIVATKDPLAGPDPGKVPLVMSAVSFRVPAGAIVAADAFIMEQPFVASYASLNPAYSTAGTWVGCFYQVAPNPSLVDLIFYETMPAVGVQLVNNNQPVSGANYLKIDRIIDPSLTATGPLGCAIVPGGTIVGGATGGGVMRWQSFGVAATSNVVIVERIHDCDNLAPGYPGCP
jgi:hypothetical protein